METELHTLGELYDRYVQLQCLAKPTEARYWLAARNLSAFIGGERCSPQSICLSTIYSDALAAFRKAMLQRMKAVSFNTERSHLSVLFNFAVRLKWMEVNPFREVPRAPVETCAPKALPKVEMAKYIQLLSTGRKPGRNGRPVDLLAPQWFWLATIRTFYLTGMRKRQLIGLVWQDVDFDERTIRLRAVNSKTRREWTIPLPDKLLPDLVKLRTLTVEIRGQRIEQEQVFCLPLFAPWKSHFTHRTMTADVLDNFFQRLRGAAPRDLTRLSSHRIRHTTATILANSVHNMKVVQEQLGHSSINTTYGYVQPDLAAMRRALDAL